MIPGPVAWRTPGNLLEVKILFKKPQLYLFIFRERGREGGREGKKQQCARNTLIGCLSYTPNWGTWPTTLGCAVTGNQTCSLSVCRPALSPLSYTSQGRSESSWPNPWPELESELECSPAIEGFFILTQGHFFMAFREGQREGEKHRCDRETLTGCLLYVPQPGIEPTAWICTLTRNQTCDFLVYRLTLRPTEPHWPGQKFKF